MGKAEKLFQNSNIEYITPFLKLWLSFNCWYKKDSEADDPPLTKDRDAINKYKSMGKIKHHFSRLLSQNSSESIIFKEAIRNLIINLSNYDLRSINNQQVSYPSNLIFVSPDMRKLKGIKLFPIEKETFIDDSKKEEFFSETLEIIYTIRCSLVHGDFDIENPYFSQLVESSYKILYPLMERVFE